MTPSPKVKRILLDAADEPPQVYRVLEELPDGRVRYESRDGVQTGTRVGMLVVRDGFHSFGGAEIRCSICGGDPMVLRDIVVVDILDRPYRGMSTRTRDNALVYADERSRHGDHPLFRPWVCEFIHRDVHGIPVRSFREWREERDAEVRT